jgi:hypothetical protein
LSELHNDIFGEFSLGPDIRNLASYKFNEIQGKKLDFFRHEMKNMHAGGVEKCRLCYEMKAKIGIKKYSEIGKRFKLFKENKLHFCEISLGFYIIENHFHTVRHINLFNRLVNSLDGNLKGEAMFNQIVDAIKLYVHEEIMREFKIILEDGDPVRFAKFLILENRAEVGKRLEEKYGFSLFEWQGLYYLQCAMIYMYFITPRVKPATKIANETVKEKKYLVDIIAVCNQAIDEKKKLENKLNGEPGINLYFIMFLVALIWYSGINLYFIMCLIALLSFSEINLYFLIILIGLIWYFFW